MRQIQASPQHNSLISRLIALALISTPLQVAAQTTGSGELGYSNSTGNTENSSLYASLKLGQELEKLKFSGAFETSFKTENKQETEERYLIDLKADYFLSKDKSFYSFAGLKFEKNEFEDINLETTTSLGLGKTLYQSEASKLTGEIGLGHQNTDYVSSGTETESQTVTIGKLSYNQQINEFVEFIQDLMVSKGSEQTKTEANTAFKVKVAEKANLKVSYKYRHNDTPAENTKKTDTQTLVTLTYDF